MKPEEISRPDKPLFPDGITKLDLARYYDRVAEVMVPHIAGRPLNLERYPDGIEGKQLFTQQAPKHFPGWIRRATVDRSHPPGTVDHVVVERRETLVYLAGLACITRHAWTSRRDRLDRPDRLVLDLDPSVDDFPSVRHAAQQAGDLFRECGLVPFAMVTGSRGIHVVAPIQRRQDHDATLAFAREAAELMVARDPEGLTLEARKVKRGTRILVDVLRNAYAHTAVAPYAVRALPEAPVAAPVPWEDLSDPELSPRRHRVGAVPAWLIEDGGPWRDMARSARPLGAARRRLAALRAEAPVP